MTFRRVSSVDGRGLGAFTLIEVLVALVLLGLVAAGGLWALTQANSNAALSRLYTGAQVAAQNQIDMIMSKGPFNPQDSQVPTVLGGPTALSAGGSTTTTENGVVIYTDPSKANGLTVTATRVTTVTDLNKSASGRNLNIYTATVIVTFTYMGDSHSVQLNALRSADIDGA